MFGKSEQRHKEVIFMYDKLIREIHSANMNLISGLTNISKEIKTMATNLDVELDALNDQIALLGPAVQKELQQVIDAINSGVAGQEAVTALEAARTRIGTMTTAVAEAVSGLTSDDVVTQ